MSDVINKTEKESAVKKTSGKTIKKKTTAKKKSVRKPDLKKKIGTGTKIQIKNYPNFDKKQKMGIIIAVVLLIVLIFGVSSCGVSHRSPKGVVSSLIESYGDGKAKKA